MRELPQSVVSGMAAIGASTERDLIEICRASARSIKQRALACALLGELRSRVSVPALLDVASAEEEPLLVWEALKAVGLIRGRLATPAVMRLARTTASSTKRQAAVYALGILADKRARSLLIRVLSDQQEDAHTRGIAAEALGLMGSTQRIVAALIQALEDPSGDVRYAALFGVEALRSAAALPAVRRLQSDRTIVDGHAIGTQATSTTAIIEGAAEEAGSPKG